MVGLIADDVTGACDSAVPFLAGGRVLMALWPHLPAAEDAACLAITTDGRDQPAEAARARARAATDHVLGLGARPYKKLDSRLRGHVSEELQGVLEAWPGRVLLCPALPAEGRVTAGGRQCHGGEVVDLREIAGTDGRVVLRDAATDADLDRVAAEVTADPQLLPAGSAGLAAALARALHPGRRLSGAWPAVRRPLGLVGSKTEVTLIQVERAITAGHPIQHRGRDGRLELGDHDALFVSGGGTAQGVLTELGASGLELCGEVVPRAPVGFVRDGPHAGLLMCVKSGGFGGPDAIADIFRGLLRGG